ncbi:class I SAM-dependent methyltransferase [Streptomyces sp. NBC_01237]|uniref:class I SAM-dependent methyltransferase n=1 Tax=Streptomyces sp. NBC_01237 TaxID=2903790 RepID=UPI002DD8F9E6|nr:class I SAM-dependent methyltransferase [Streptomyces sp. NBC_01237]WRZ77267.1 class I SAM-dependent methyltransferase [Streptomyces sp. NBC_01237]
MAPQDALLGWDEPANAQAYEAFTRAFPMYDTTSRDLARRAQLDNADLVVDLCGGAGATARALLDLLPARARVVSLDSAAAMQQVGRRTLPDPRLTWVTASAEQLSNHLAPGSVDVVVCNSALWKTDVPAVCEAAARVLRPQGRFVFNIGGGFAGVRHPDEETSARPSLNTFIRQIAEADHGYIAPPLGRTDPKLPPETITQHLNSAGLYVTDAEVTAQHSTMAEKKAWLSIPLFARPEGNFTHEQRMEILEAAYARTVPEARLVTSWLVITAELPKAAA